MEALTRLWGALEAVTSTVSVAFVLVISLILVVYAIVYLVAAYIVLLRFARSAESLRLIILCVVFICPAYALLWLQVRDPQLGLATWAVWVRSLAGLTAGLYLVCAVVLPIGLAALRRGLPGLIGVVGLAALMGVLVSGLLGRLEEGSLFEAMALGLMALGGLVLIPLAVAGLLEIRRGAEWFIATRYLTAERRQVFISAITLICVGAVAAGVWLIITVLSVMNGFERTWREEIVGNYAHFLVRSYYGEVVGYEALLREIESVDGVLAASPYLDAEGMVRGANGVIAPVRLHGIDPVRAVRVTRFAEKMIDGRLDDLVAAEGAPDTAPPGLLIGNQMAEKLGLSVGDAMIVISPEGGPSSPLGVSPRLVRFTVLGTFESSFLPFDEFFAYGSLSAVQDFLSSGDVVAGFKVRTDDFYRSRRVADRVEATLGHPFYGRDWKELFPAFFHALNDNRSLMFMLLVMIMVVSAFVIVV
ncbi:MAG: ABC transporter permease, partial [Myxococcota bacterium]